MTTPATEGGRRIDLAGRAGDDDTALHPHHGDHAPPVGLVLPAYRDGGQLAVWCMHEQRWHRHGGCTGRCAPRQANRFARTCECPPGSADGLRGAHCVCHVARERSYYVREVGPLTPAVRRAVGPQLSYSRSCHWGDCRFQRAGRRTCARRYRRWPS